jgi:hypothetical protein
MQIDLPDVVAEVRAAFERYEKALVTNDVATLDKIFRNDPRTIRYGQAENSYGYREIEAFRAARPSAGLARTLSKTVITTFGREVGASSSDTSASSTSLPRRTWRRSAKIPRRPDETSST